MVPSERMVVAVMFSSAPISFEFMHAIGWLDPQHIRAMFVVILGSGSNIVFEVMPFG